MSTQAQRVTLLERVGYVDLGEIEPGWRALRRRVTPKLTSFVFLGPREEARYSNELDVTTAWPLSAAYLFNLARRLDRT